MVAFPMYVPKTIHSRYIGIQHKYQIPMYPKKEYIGTPQNHAIPMYLPLKIYHIKQPALPHTPNSKRISAQIIMKIHRNPAIACNPDVSYLPNPSKTPQIKYQNNYLDSLK